jgi:hypothetical protein
MATSEKDTRLVKSNTLHSSTEFNSGAGGGGCDEALGAGGESINRFEIELNDELEDNEEDDCVKEDQTPQAIKVETLPSSSSTITTNKTSDHNNDNKSLGSGVSRLFQTNTISTTNRKILVDEEKKKREEIKAREKWLGSRFQFPPFIN